MNWSRFSLSALILLVAGITSAQADVTSTFSQTKLKSCDDYATIEFNNPWDMSDSADVNNFFPGIDINQFSSASFSSGAFSAVAGATYAGFYLVSPVVCGAYGAGGRYGPDHPIDTSRYTRLVIRMYIDQVDPYGLKLRWNRSCYSGNANTTFTALNAIPTNPGWHTYTIDLNQVGLDPASTDTRPWSAGSITGLAILPTAVPGARVLIDWIRLEDPTSCATVSTSVSSSVAANGSDDVVSYFLDDNNNPFDGYLSALGTGLLANAGNYAFSISGTSGFIPGSYVISALLDSDFASLEYANPWDMNDEADVLFPRISGAVIANGTYSGTAQAGANIYLINEDKVLDAAKYNKLSIKITKGAGNMTLFHNGGSVIISDSNRIAPGSDIYQVDLPTAPGSGAWTGSITGLVLQLPAGAFSLDFVSIRHSGYDQGRDANAMGARLFASQNSLLINQPPLITLERPSLKGGEAVRPWNMNAGDFALFANLDGADDPLHPGEKRTTFLPDVRLVDGLRGDFFKGSSVNGSDDPTNYSQFPAIGSDLFTFSAEDFRNLCFRVLIDRAFDLGGGSVARVLYKRADSGFVGGEDLVLIGDGWKAIRWQEYCLDMKNLLDDGKNSSSWLGTIDAFRVDPHEFSTQTTYYFDYIKLRRDDRTSSKFSLTYDFSDADDDAEVQFYYTTVPGSLGTLINGAKEDDETSVLLWDTQLLPRGTYYVNTVASDGYNTVTRYGRARLVLGSDLADAAPLLDLEAPSSNAVACSGLQVKGYALQADRLEDVAVVEFFIDDVLVGRVHPSDYCLRCRAALPTLDSSNAGFDVTLATSALSTGAHQLVAKAYSSRGTITSVSRSFTKQDTGCTATVVDPSPAGVPVEVGVTPAPTPSQTSNSLAIGKVKHDKRKMSFSLTLSGLKSEYAGCAVALEGAGKSTSFTEFYRFTPSSAQLAAGKLVLTKAKLKVSSKLTEKAKLRARWYCSSSSASLAPSRAKVLKLVKGSKGVGTVAKLFNALKSLK